jgi:hypothetical protein
VGELQVGCADKCSLGSSLLSAPSPRPWAVPSVALATRNSVGSCSFFSVLFSGSDYTVLNGRAVTP